MSVRRRRFNGATLVRLFALPLVATLLTACPHGDVFPPPLYITFNGTQYAIVPASGFDVPEADLTAIGIATQPPGQEILADTTVYAVKDIDPTQLIVLRIDPEATSRPGDTFSPFLADGVALPLPEAICGYYDATSFKSPSDFC